MDGITLHAVQMDLQKRLPDVKLEKIYQPEKDELLFQFRSGDKLFISINPANARVQLTELPHQNPPQAPTFCMLLRKHLGSAKVIDVTQPNFERVLHINFEGIDEMGYKTKLTLIIETMGKHSNLFLVRENGILIDSLKHGSLDYLLPNESKTARLSLPGYPYVDPPAQNKRNPLLDTQEDILSLLLESEKPLDQLIWQTWSGFSPVFAKEASLSTGYDSRNMDELTLQEKEVVSTKLFDFFTQLREGDFHPRIIVNSYNEAIDYYPIVSLEYASEFQKPMKSIHEALDTFYSMRDYGNRFRQKANHLSKLLRRSIERCQKKLSIQTGILNQNNKMERDKQYGELLTSYAHTIPKGADKAIVQNYYDENMAEISIPLDINKTIIENAQKYFKRYGKTKRAQQIALVQVEQLTQELSYLEGQLDNIAKSTTDDELQQITDELVEQHYIRPAKTSAPKKKQKAIKTKPLHFVSTDGADIYVGKNNVQNEQLTLHFATGSDIWLHTKEIPGSHVIIKQSDPSKQTLLEAVHLAAYYSKGRNGSQVPVDYTERKNIKKPKGTPPGLVIYSTNQTAFITPDEEIVKTLQQIE